MDFAPQRLRSRACPMLAMTGWMFGGMGLRQDGPSTGWAFDRIDVRQGGRFTFIYIGVLFFLTASASYRTLVTPFPFDHDRHLRERCSPLLACIDQTHTSDEVEVLGSTRGLFFLHPHTSHNDPCKLILLCDKFQVHVQPGFDGARTRLHCARVVLRRDL